MTTETAAPLTLETINLGDEMLFEEGRAHEAFKILRRESQSTGTTETNRSRAGWNLTRYADVCCFAQSHLFSSERGIGSFEPVDETYETAAAAGTARC